MIIFIVILIIIVVVIVIVIIFIIHIILITEHILILQLLLVIVLLLLQGRDIVTQVGQGDFGFFRLHLNHFNMVEGITCLAKDVRDDDVITFPNLSLNSLYSVCSRCPRPT